MQQILDRLFLAHPRTVNESYLEHCAFAFRIGSRLLLAGAAALVHAVVPCLCETTASRIILALNADIVARRAKANQPQAKEPLFGFAEYI
jgi:hypothetical protein